MKKAILIFMLSISTACVYAQDVRTTKLAWTVTALTDLTTNNNSSYASIFKTNGRQAIIWKQKNGSYNTSLTVTQLSGSWENVQTEGQVVYDITLDGETGTLTFARNATGTFITIDLSQAGGSRLKHRYTVEQVVSF